MKVYRRHNCERQHKSARTFLRCAFPRAAWCTGKGDYALIAWCNVPTITLWRTPEEAEDQKAAIDAAACGGRCRRQHEVIRIVWAKP